ncbi:MAG: pyridoxal phosphate-dependent aminotransferase [Oscillospiraceae bacterium]|nr:pyridoxal phosphate-dependent aminotransferase [Oscillospiraceae bacterium]
MINLPFDHVINRKGTNSEKFDYPVERGLPADVLPLWVADMDFQAPAGVREALSRRIEHGIFGYSGISDSYHQAVGGWFRDKFGWETQREWLVPTPGVVYALATAVRAFTQPGDRVLIQPPVYYPFYSVIGKNGRQLVENQLRYDNGRYSMDLADFERKIVDNDVKLFILCSPHNPVCRVWTREELRAVGEICLKHDVIVLSDEIHCDFTFPGHPHTIFPLAVPEMAHRSLVCTAPSKSFNLAGLQTSNIWIPGQQLRERYLAELDRAGTDMPNVMGLIACEAAYASCGQWLEECRSYMQANLAHVRDYLARYLPQIRLVEPEGTYFAWLDCSGLGLSAQALNELIIHRAKLWLDAGEIFGQCAQQFQRVVLACPRATLDRALDQLRAAVESLE